MFAKRCLKLFREIRPFIRLNERELCRCTNIIKFLFRKAIYWILLSFGPSILLYWGRLCFRFKNSVVFKFWKGFFVNDAGWKRVSNQMVRSLNLSYANFQIALLNCNSCLVIRRHENDRISKFGTHFCGLKCRACEV